MDPSPAARAAAEALVPGLKSHESVADAAADAAQAAGVVLQIGYWRRGVHELDQIRWLTGMERVQA